MRWKVAIPIATAVIVSWSVANLAAADPGDLDPAFGHDGKVTTNFISPPQEEVAFAVTVGAGGKTVAAGTTNGCCNAGNGRFAISRYNVDGSLDTSFGGDGRVTTNFSKGDDNAASVVVQSDGNIVAGGGTGGDNGKFALARYNVDGSLDTSFGGDGRVTTNFTPYGEAANVALQPDGKIVAAGEAGGGGPNPMIAVARYNADGTLDRTFGSGGRVTTDLTRYEDSGWALVIQPDGKIVVVGQAGFRGFDKNAKLALVRYDADGSLDTTFGNQGIVETDLTKFVELAYAVALQSDGEIVVAGVAGGGGDRQRMAVARYESDGSLDTGFGDEGWTSLDVTPQEDEARGVVIQSDGKIVIGGISGLFAPDGSLGPNPMFALARFDADGTLDATFGDGGTILTDFTPDTDLLFALAMAPSGEIVAAGASGAFRDANTKVALARYLPS
jgi:uncharacterized delta-60 repeat protein